MATRGVMQLRRLRLIYCEHGGSSKHVRDFLSSDTNNKLVEWARNHPSVYVSVHVHNGRHPRIQGDYVTGNPKKVSVANEPQKRILQVMDMLYNSSGRKISKLKKPVITATPSIQGSWTPMLHLQQTKFPIRIVQE